MDTYYFYIIKKQTFFIKIFIVSIDLIQLIRAKEKTKNEQKRKLKNKVTI